MNDQPLIISNHFSYDELTRSRTATQAGISNTPCPDSLRSLAHLVTNLLEPLRELYGKPIYITSGFRSPELNRLVGGIPDSQHTRGEAIDCTTTDCYQMLEVLTETGIPFDQAILYRKRHFLHLSLKPGGNNRYQVIYKE